MNAIQGNYARRLLVVCVLSLLALLTVPAVSHAAPGQWAATGSMSIGRWNDTATMLGNGDVLVSGGQASLGGQALATAELYDPSTGIWSATELDVKGPREPDRHVVAGRGGARGRWRSRRLADGRAVQPGQRNLGQYRLAVHGAPSGYLQRCCPAVKSSWPVERETTTVPSCTTRRPGPGLLPGSMPVAPESAVAALLPDGQVLVAGGSGSGGPLANAELYNPANGGWSTTGSMSNGALRRHHRHRASQRAGAHRRRAEAPLTWHCPPPSSTTRQQVVWTATGTMANGRVDAAAALLDNGQILVAGGLSPSDAPIASVELYNPTAGTWTTTASMSAVRNNPTATVLASGQVLIAGGLDASDRSSQASSELYTPPVAPDASVTAPSNVSPTTAVLQAMINPEGSDTTYQFQLSTSPLFTSPILLPSAAVDAGAGDTTAAVSAPTSGLVPSTAYDERVIATNVYGMTTISPAQQFATPAVPGPVVTAPSPPFRRRTSPARPAHHRPAPSSHPASRWRAPGDDARAATRGFTRRRRSQRRKSTQHPVLDQGRAHRRLRLRASAQHTHPSPQRRALTGRVICATHHQRPIRLGQGLGRDQAQGG